MQNSDLNGSALTLVLELAHNNLIFNDISNGIVFSIK